MMIPNCGITGSDADVLKTFKYTADNRYSTYSYYHSGVDLSGDVAYSVCNGRVVYVGESDDGRFGVIVQYSGDVFFQYKNITDTLLTAGDDIVKGSLIGGCDKYVHFEYITSGENEWPVRVVDRTYYKHDPMPLIEDGFSEFNEIPSVFLYSSEYDENVETCFPESAAEMLSNNKGDD